jgi:hypothetical protein
MDLTPYVDALRRDLAVAAEAGGDDARALAERLVTPLESAVRLALLDVLSTAAEEITRDLAPGSVDLRLRGREPDFVVTFPPAVQAPVGYEPSAHEDALRRARSAGEEAASQASPEGEEGAMVRINFRLSEQLKGRVEEAAGQAALSVNAWLVRAATAALDRDERPAGGAERRPERPHAPWSGQRYRGWVR